MKRHMLISVAVLGIIPAAVAAQLPSQNDEGWGPRVRATPFVGFSPGFTSSGSLAVYTGLTIRPGEYSFDYAPGPVSGVGVEVRAYNRFSGIASAAWSSRGHTNYLLEDGTQYQDAGSDFYLVKLGGSMRFRESDPELQLRRLNASVFAAGAFIREVPEVTLLSSSGFTQARNQYGVNFGAEAELPLTNKMLAFHAAIEDFVVFWDELALQERLIPSVKAAYGNDAVAEVDADHSSIWVVRLGLSVRFGR